MSVLRRGRGDRYCFQSAIDDANYRWEHHSGSVGRGSGGSSERLFKRYR